MTSRLNISLAMLLVVVTTLTVAMRPDPTRPNVEFMPDMKYSPAPLAYAPSSIFANGRTLQAPVAGTIPRGAMPLHYAATKEDALRAGEELINPYKDALAAEAAATDGISESETDETTEAANVATEEANVAAATPVETEPTTAERLRASIQRGGERYRVYCTTCHGPTGEGDGPVPQRGFPPPPSLRTGNSRLLKDGQLFHILTYGQGNMPQFVAQLSPHDRWDMINYIRDMQPPLEQPAAAEKAEAVEADAVEEETR